MANLRDEFIYFIGGTIQHGSAVRKCERFQISTGEWGTVTDLKLARSSASSCVITERYIYAICGQTKDYGSVECLDSQADEWERLEIYKDDTNLVGRSAALVLPISQH